MEWLTTLLSVIAGGSLVSVIEIIRYRKQSIKMKNLSVEKEQIEVQSEKLDLVTKYLEKVLSLTESKEKDYDLLMAKIDSVIEYLDGPYKKWLNQQAKKLKSK